MRPLIIYHANCTDGFTAAWIAKRAMPESQLFEGFYGKEPPDVKGRTVFVLDFSYKRPVMERLCAEARRVVILDHHKTAEADLAGLGDDTGETKLQVIFDMQRSGAVITWDFFHPNEPRPWLVEYVQDRDLWRWELADSRLVSAGIEAVRKELEEWDSLAGKSVADLVREGAVIERYRRICIEAAFNLARPMEIGGHRVRAANTSEMRFASDTAHELAQNYPFGATYWVRNDGVVQWSLRSRDGGIDVSAVAVKFGGGGHAHAAGFQTPISYLVERLA